MSNVGVLGATYTLDGATIPQIHNVTSPTLEYQEAPNFLLYSLVDLPHGDHTLVVNITMANNHEFVLDYITYNPSFELLLNMPLLGNTTPTTTFRSINSPTPLGSPTPQTSNVQPLPTAAILGGVNGVLAVVLLAILGRWLFLHRRRTKQTEDPSPYNLYEHYHQPGNGMLNYSKVPSHRLSRSLIPDAFNIPQPLRLDTQGLQPVKFRPQTTDSHTRPLPELPNIDIRPTETDSDVAAIPPPISLRQLEK